MNDELKKRLAEIESKMNQIEPKSYFDSSEFNPLFAYHFAQYKGIDLSATLFEKRTQKSYLDLRKEQNEASAYNLTVSGIELARTKDLKGAIEKYDNALGLDGNCIDALVARGAAFANQSKFKLAISDFEKALMIDPDHGNAKKYLARLLASEEERRQREKEMKKSIIAGEFVLPNDYKPGQTIEKYIQPDSSRKSKKPRTIPT